MVITNYKQAEDFLFSKKEAGISYTLDRMKALMKELGHPESRIRAIHVAGTNGKGSTCAFLSSVLQEAGYSVGAFNTPTFGDERNQVTVNDQPLSEGEFVKACNQIFPAVTKVEEQRKEMVSPFECMVAISYHYFASVFPVDIVLVEAGMGGRLDATNVLTGPLATVITNVALDHQQYLGESVDEIAREKAGIVKKTAPLFTACTGKALEELKVVSKEMGVHIYEASDTVGRYKPDMLGWHQELNATLAVSVIEQLSKSGVIEVEQKHFINGIKKAYLPGRWERITESPEIILDTAHNVEAMGTVCEQIKEQLNDRKVDILFAAMRDKPVKGMVDVLSKMNVQIHFTNFDSERSLKRPEYEALSVLEKGKFIPVYENWINEWKLRAEKDSVLLVTGSHQFVGEVRDTLEE